MYSEPDSSSIKSRSQQDEEGCNGCKEEELDRDSKKEASICNKWSAIDKIILTKLTYQPTLADTVPRMFQQTIQKQVDYVIAKMSWEEREMLKRKLGK
jgi:hypothetical protein